MTKSRYWASNGARVFELSLQRQRRYFYHNLISISLSIQVLEANDSTLAIGTFAGVDLRILTQAPEGQ
jgi:hypothetical protein